MKYARAVFVGSLLLGLVGCGGPSGALYGYPSSSQGPFSTTGPDNSGCGGTGGVQVRPCPVTLTKTKSTVNVTVSGPKVVDSAIKTNKKNRSGCGSICEVGQSSSNPLEYSVSAGTKCGMVTISFYGYNQSGGTVGIGRLRVINKDC